MEAQVAAPILRCVSVTSPTSTSLSWIIPTDPGGLFTQYQIYTSATGFGFSLAGTVNSFAQTTFVHAPSGTSSQSYYYYVVTVSSAGTATSTPSDTLKSIFLNMTGAAVNGVASLNWNAMHTPLLPSSSPTYTVSREYPTNTWTTIYIGDRKSVV